MAIRRILESEMLLGRLPLAAYGRYDGALFLQFCESLIDFLAVDTCDFCNLACVNAFSTGRISVGLE